MSTIFWWPPSEQAADADHLEGAKPPKSGFCQYNVRLTRPATGLSEKLLKLESRESRGVLVGCMCGRGSIALGLIDLRSHLQHCSPLTQPRDYTQCRDLSRCGVFSAWPVLDRHGEVRAV